MSFEHFDQLFVGVGVGLALILVGGLNLVFGRRGRLVWLRTVAALGVCAAVVAGLQALTRTEIAYRTGAILLGVLAVAAVLGSEWSSRRFAALFTAIRVPAVRWGLVAVGGLAAILVGGFTFEQRDAAVADRTLREIECAMGHPTMAPVAHVRSATDRGTQIVPKESIDHYDAGELKDAEERALRGTVFHDRKIRRSGATDNSNCHGWVFTGGKYMLSPDDVELILKENGYQEVQQPQPGDLVVYRQGGAVAHTALVRYVTEGQPVLVEGKWGRMGVFLHPADESLYGPEFTFHRSGRSGHLLVGFGGSPGPVDQNAAAATEE
jgi:hypothetical protein